MTLATTRMLCRAALLLLLCAVNTTGEAPPSARSAAAGHLPRYPSVRFTAWDQLSHDVRQRARDADYNEKNWNKVNTFEAEDFDYESLKPRFQDFIDNLPISAESWDCWVNHYRNYEWDEFTPSVETSYMALGWTDDMWNGDEEPEEEGKYWGDLTAVQQQAATSICYTQQIWDEVEIPLWDDDDGEGGEKGEQDASDLYSNMETKVVEEKQDIYEQIYGGDDKSGIAFDGPASAHNDRGIEVPFFRYDPWDLLDPELKAIAKKADYDEKSWNAIGTNEWEQMDWEAIGDEDRATQRALHKMGFSEDQWDCYMLHYRTYEWIELEEAGVKQFFKILGYSHKSWELDVTPEADGMYWPDLTEEQRNAAYQVGYFREVWDEVSLQFWPRTTSNSASLKEYVKKHRAAVGGGTSALLVGLIVVLAFGCRFMSKKKKTPRGTKDFEMSGGDRFTDYSDETATNDGTSGTSGSGSDDNVYDEDYQPETKPIV